MLRMHECIAAPLKRNGQKTCPVHSGTISRAVRLETAQIFLKHGMTIETGGHKKYCSVFDKGWAKKFTPLEFDWGIAEKYLSHTQL